MKKELGKWLMDIAKYMITAVIISSVFNSVQDDALIYWAGLPLALLIVTWGLYLQKESIKKTKKRK